MYICNNKALERQIAFFIQKTYLIALLAAQSRGNCLFIITNIHVKHYRFSDTPKSNCYVAIIND